MKKLIIICVLFMSFNVILATTTTDDCLESMCAYDIEGILVHATTVDLEPGESVVYVYQEEFLVFVYRAQNDNLTDVFMCCGLQERLTHIRDDMWGKRYFIERLDEAIIGYHFSEWRVDEFVVSTPFQLWRGDNALPAPSKSDELLGTIRQHTLQSSALETSRGLTIYYPPRYDANATYPVIYSTDGHSIEGYAPFVDYLIANEAIPPMLIVGVHSSNLRAEEYLPGQDAEVFARHEQFFTVDVRLWAETTLGASADPTQRVVHGFSNGGVFATAMALRHPEIYQIAFPFSAGMNPLDAFPDAKIESELRLYFAAGTLETGFFRVTSRLATHFEQAGADVIWHPRVAGHDFFMWQEEFVSALLWAFGTQ